MAERFLQKILEIHKEPIMDQIPKYSNKEKVKKITKKYEEIFSKLNKNKKMHPKSLLNLLSEKVEYLEKNTQIYQKQLDQIKKINSEKETQNLKKEKIEKNLEKTNMIKTNIKKKQESLIKDIEKKFDDNKKENEIYINNLEEKFGKAQQDVSHKLNRKEMLKKQKEFLEEQKGKIVKEMTESIKKIEKDYIEKEEKVKLINIQCEEQITKYEKEAGKKEDVEKGKKKEIDFYNKYFLDVEILEKDICKYEDLMKDSLGDIKNILKKVEKIKKINSKDESNQIKNWKKLKETNDKLFSFIDTNLHCRKKIKAEQKKQLMFEKLIKDLNKKLEQ